MHQRTWIAIPVGIGFSRVESESRIHSTSPLLAGRMGYHSITFGVVRKSQPVRIQMLECANQAEEIPIVTLTGWGIDGYIEGKRKSSHDGTKTANDL